MEVKEMETKDLYCLHWHFKHLYESCINDLPSDLAIICMKCKYAESCKFDHVAAMQRMQQITGISICYLINPQEHLDRWDNYLDQGRGCRPLTGVY